jgi:hypothetical protein
VDQKSEDFTLSKIDPKVEVETQQKDLSQNGFDSETEAKRQSREWERIDSPVTDTVDKPPTQQFAVTTPRLTSKIEIPIISIDNERLMADIHHTAQFGTGKRWGPTPNDVGMARLSLSDSDKEVRDWFVKTAKTYGCKTHVDEMGNIFAIRPGRKEGPPTMMGSHLDTQPAGGRYDGILGVLAGLAAIRTLHRKGVETEFPVGVVNWTK